MKHCDNAAIKAYCIRIWKLMQQGCFNWPRVVNSYFKNCQRVGSDFSREEGKQGESQTGK